MTVRGEIAQSRGEVHGAKNNERHACGRHRVGEVAVSCAWSHEGPEAYLKQYVEDLSGEPARLRASKPACRRVVAANSRLQQNRHE